MLDLLKETEGAEEIGIIGHIRPDGDCVGSCLSLYCYLSNAYRNSGKRITVFLEKPSGIYSYLKGFSEIDSMYGYRKLNVCFSLDCSTPDRLGDGFSLFDSADRTVCIDHHISNQ